MAEVERDHPNGIAVVEAALLIEAGAAKDFDKIIVVDLRLRAQGRALRAAHGSCRCEAARAEVERRSAAQFSDEEKARHADYVIENSGPLEDTERQVEKIWEELQALAGRMMSTDNCCRLRKPRSFRYTFLQEPSISYPEIPN